MIRLDIGNPGNQEERDRSAWANDWLVEWKSTTSSENQCQEEKNPQSYEPSLGYILFELARCDRYYPSDPYNLSSKHEVGHLVSPTVRRA